MKAKYWRFLKWYLFGATIFFVISFFLNAVAVHDFSQKALCRALIDGLVNGFVFGVVIPWKGRGRIYHGFNYDKINVDKLLEADEHIVYQSPAIHIKTYDNIDGKLTLTNRRLIFIPDRWKKTPDIILLDELKKVRKRKMLGFIPTGINLYTQTGKKTRFMVDDWEEWLRIIKDHSQMVAVHE